jgi:hypothetical protein
MVAKQKKSISEIHDKYYGNKKHGKDGGPSRAYLMEEARKKDIKNFRVLNKLELSEIMTIGVTQQRIDEIIAGAVARWKAGWGKRKKAVLA